MEVINAKKWNYQVHIFYLVKTDFIVLEKIQSFLIPFTEKWRQSDMRGAMLGVFEAIWNSLF